MKDKWEIILSGVGGQGLIVSGTILGEAATVYEDINATLTSSYGVEARGTFVKSDLIISKREIFYPEVIREDIVVALAPVAYNKYVSNLDESSILIYDRELVEDVKVSKAKQEGYPITKVAAQLGNPAIANIIAIGIIVKITGIVNPESVIKAIKKRFGSKPGALKLNIEAFYKGLEMADNNGCCS